MNDVIKDFESVDLEEDGGKTVEEAVEEDLEGSKIHEDDHFEEVDEILGSYILEKIEWDGDPQMYEAGKRLWKAINLTPTEYSMPNVEMNLDSTSLIETISRYTELDSEDLKSMFGNETLTEFVEDFPHFQEFVDVISDVTVTDSDLETIALCRWFSTEQRKLMADLISRSEESVRVTNYKDKDLSKVHRACLIEEDAFVNAANDENFSEWEGFLRSYWKSMYAIESTASDSDQDPLVEDPTTGESITVVGESKSELEGLISDPGKVEELNEIQEEFLTPYLRNFLRDEIDKWGEEYTKDELDRFAKLMIHCTMYESTIVGDRFSISTEVEKEQVIEYFSSFADGDIGSARDFVEETDLFHSWSDEYLNLFSGFTDFDKINEEYDELPTAYDDPEAINIVMQTDPEYRPLVATAAKEAVENDEQLTERHVLRAASEYGVNDVVPILNGFKEAYKKVHKEGD